MKRSEPALFHANRGFELAKKAEKEDSNWKDWHIPFIYEVMARAHAADGNKDECRKYIKISQEAIDELKDPDDKKICQGELGKISD
ncbi:MAG: hypothetical protein ACE5H4_07655 [Candidatus Thorarchaeota archaeon]